MSTTDKDIRYAITAEDRFSRAFAQLKRDVKDTRGQFDGLIGKASQVDRALGSIALGGAIGGAGLALGIKQLINDLDALNDAADATGSSVENLSALEDVARRNGESLDTVVTAALKLNKVLTEAKPDSAMAQALESIGLNATQLRQMDPSEAVQKVAVALSGYANDGDKARLIQELFGKSTKELAAFLKDLAAAGQLNAKVTSEQADQAERFNKEIFALQTNASNAARVIGGEFAGAINQLLDAIRGGGGDTSPLSKWLTVPMQTAAVLGANVAFVLKGIGTEIGGIAAQAAAFATLDFSGAAAIGRFMKEDAARARADLDELVRRIMNIGTASERTFEPWGREVRDRSLPSVPKIPEKKGAKGAGAGAGDRVSEAMRYLEQLQKQGEKLQDLTTYQQLLRDIENKRIDGITPELERELKMAAQKVDLQRDLNLAKEREASFQRALSDKDQRDIDEVQRLLDQTTTGKLQGLESQADKLLSFSRRISEDDPRQKQVLDAMKALRAEQDKILSPADDAGKAYDKLADTIEKSMDRATDAVLDFVVDGKGGVQDLGRAFGRDVLRSLFEDPVRDSMKQVSKFIRDALTGSGGGGGLGSLFGGGGSPFGGLFNLFGGGSTSRANGGPVSAGSLVRWQENGREWFVPGTDGTVLNQAQMKAMGAPSVSQVNHITIQGGGDPREVQRQIDSALSRNNAALVRSLRSGNLSRS